MSDYNEGDLVEAVKGDTVIRGRLVRAPEHLANPMLRLSLALRSDIPHLVANGYTVTVIERAKPVVVLPTAEGSGIFWNEHDMKGTRVAMRTGSFHGARWHHQRPGELGTSEYTDSGIRALVGNHKFTVVEPVAETAARFAARLRSIVQPKIDSRWYTKSTAAEILNKADVIAAEFGVTGETKL